MILDMTLAICSYNPASCKSELCLDILLPINEFGFFSEKVIQGQEAEVHLTISSLALPFWVSLLLVTRQERLICGLDRA